MKNLSHAQGKTPKHKLLKVLTRCKVYIKACTFFCIGMMFGCTPENLNPVTNSSVACLLGSTIYKALQKCLGTTALVSEKHSKAKISNHKSIQRMSNLILQCMRLGKRVIWPFLKLLVNKN
jgi:hypothetical protein